MKGPDAMFLAEGAERLLVQDIEVRARLRRGIPMAEAA